METEGKEQFDYDTFRRQAIERLLSGDKELTGKNGVLAPLLKDLLDATLSGELQAYVEQNRPNRRNGSKPKTVKTDHGPVSMEMPRDREGNFEPKLIGKRQTTLGEGLDNRILSLYSKGMSYEWKIYTDWKSVPVNYQPSPTRCCRWSNNGAVGL
jgi:putative transposase